MPKKPNLKPVLEEKDFARRVLAEIESYEKNLADSGSKMSLFDKIIAKRVRVIINDNSEPHQMVNKVFDLLHKAWSISATIAAFFYIECLKDKLLRVVCELDKDYRIRTLTTHNNFLVAENEEIKKKCDSRVEHLKAEHAAEVVQIKKEASLDKKHLEKAVESLSSTIKTEVSSLKDMMKEKAQEVVKLQAENAALLQMIAKLKEQARTKRITKDKI